MDILEDIEEKQKKEIDFWKTSPIESPSCFTIENIVNKMSEAKIFLSKLHKYKSIFNDKNSILEIGGGQGWASCILKKSLLTKGVKLINSDISKYAVESNHNWERVFEINIDNIVCKSYEIPLKDNSIDLAFTFQAAHHFYKHNSTLKENHRILKKGGVCLYLYEQSCRRYIYTLVYNRAVKKRPEVAEDVLIYNRILYLAKKIGFETTAYYDTYFQDKTPFAMGYYFMASKLTFLRYFLPCFAMDYIFTKR